MKHTEMCLESYLPLRNIKYTKRHFVTLYGFFAVSHIHTCCKRSFLSSWQDLSFHNDLEKTDLPVRASAEGRAMRLRSPEAFVYKLAAACRSLLAAFRFRRDIFASAAVTLKVSRTDSTPAVTYYKTKRHHKCILTLENDHSFQMMSATKYRNIFIEIRGPPLQTNSISILNSNKFG